MRSTAHEYGREGIRRQSQLERLQNFRSVWSRGRLIEANVDVQVIPRESSNGLVDEQTGDDILTWDAGIFDGSGVFA